MSCAARSRRGMSVVEFVACLSAMVGGVVLGSMYLGVDMRRMGLAVLKQAQLIDAGKEVSATADVSPATTPAADATPAVAADSAVPAKVDDSTAVSEKPAAPAKPERPAATPQPTESASQTPAASEPLAAVIPPATAAANEPPKITAADSQLTKLLNPEDLISLTDDQRRTLTLAYWAALDACMKDECTNRLASIRSGGDFTLFDFLTCRKQGHQQAVEFISQLNMRGVDPHVAAYAQKALAWHKDGVTLFSRALDLLTDAPTAQFTGPFAQSWQSASTQHQMEERLLGEKHVAVQDYLDHTLPATSAAPAPPSTTAAQTQVAAPTN